MTAARIDPITSLECGDAHSRVVARSVRKCEREGLASVRVRRSVYLSSYSMLRKRRGSDAGSYEHPPVRLSGVGAFPAPPPPPEGPRPLGVGPSPHTRLPIAVLVDPGGRCRFLSAWRGLANRRRFRGNPEWGRASARHISIVVEAGAVRVEHYVEAGTSLDAPSGEAGLANV